MAKATLTIAQAAAIVLARSHADKATRQAIKRDIFTTAKTRFGIPQDMKLKAHTTPGVEGYLVLKTKSGDTFDLEADGLWIGADRSGTAGALSYVTLSAAKVSSVLQDYVTLEAGASDVVSVSDTAPDGYVPPGPTTNADGSVTLSVLSSDIDFAA